MAGRDFASVKASSRRKPGKKKRTTATISPGWMIAALTLMIACFALGVWIGKSQGRVTVRTDHEAEQRLQQQLAEQQRKLEALQAEKQALQQRLQAQQGEVGELTFYSELPRQSVTPAPLSESHAAPASSSHAAKKDDVSHLIEQEMAKGSAPATVRYHIQVGSFRRESDARRLLHRLQKAHVSGSIQAVELTGKGRWFRVIAGPFHSRLLADHAREDIEKKLHLRDLVVYAR